MPDSFIEPIEASSAVIAEFRNGFKQHAVEASLRQEKLNALSRRLENSSRLMDGIGQLKYRIDPDLYQHMKAIFGPDCWKDPAFTDALERDGVIQRVKGISDKIISIAPARKPESDPVLDKHTFADSELPAPSTNGIIDGSEVQATDQVVS